MQPDPQKKNNVDPNEIAKFEKMAPTWWDPEGEFKPLHKLNPLRLNYIDQTCGGVFGKRILDVGCGGGILSESMARIGANVDGLDMGTEPLDVARLHALEMGVDVHYIQNTAESHRDTHPQVYDVITCMEMLEHVPNPGSVIQACADMLKPGGYAFFSTINNNLRAYVEAILGAEYILRILPIGTHDPSKFIKPSQLISLAEDAELFCENAIGITFNPLTDTFRYTKRVDVNYMIATKKSQD